MQHDHHCVITYLALNWRIIASRPGEIKVQVWTSGHTMISTWIKLANVDFESYAALAVQLDYVRAL